MAGTATIATDSVAADAVAVDGGVASHINQPNDGDHLLVRDYDLAIGARPLALDHAAAGARA